MCALPQKPIVLMIKKIKPAAKTGLMCFGHNSENLPDAAGYCWILSEAFFVFFLNVCKTKALENAQPYKHLRTVNSCSFKEKNLEYTQPQKRPGQRVIDPEIAQL